jgi:toluene monooxygenase system ferredoxin subunit
MAWQKICKLDDVAPGTLREVSAAGVPMLFVRGHDGFAAIPPSCPHMENPLCEGLFDGEVLTCLKHLWQWTIPDGAPMGEAEVPLLKYDIEARDGDVWVNVEGELKYNP